MPTENLKPEKIETWKNIAIRKNGPTKNTKVKRVWWWKNHPLKSNGSTENPQIIRIWSRKKSEHRKNGTNKKAKRWHSGCKLEIITITAIDGLNELTTSELK